MNKKDLDIPMKSQTCIDNSDNDYINFLNNVNFIHEVKIYNEIQNHKKILIFDLRKREIFKNSNLIYSINIPYDEYDKQFFIKFEECKYSKLTKNLDLKEMIFRYKRYYIVIVMSEEKIARKKILNFVETFDKEEKEIISKSLLLYKSLVEERVRELGLFNLGFKKFVDHYRFIVRSFDQPSLTK